MSIAPRPAVTPQAVIGVSICLMGIALTLDNFGVIELRSLAELWPIVPISIGVLTLMYGQSRQEYVKGTLWLALGVFFIFRHPLMRDVWPLALIVLGGYLVWRARTGPPPARKWATEVRLETDRWDSDPGVGAGPAAGYGPGATPYDASAGVPPPVGTSGAPSGASGAPFSGPPPIPESHRARSGCGPSWTRGRARNFTAGSGAPGVPPGGGPAGERPDHAYAGFAPPPRTANGPGQRPSLFALMSGVRRQVTGAFAGAEATAIMGGVELDLRYAAMDGDEVVIDTFALWGGIEVWVPQHWEIVSQGLPLMGAFEDKTRVTTHGRQPRLVVRGVAVMGSVEIKN